MNFYNYPNNPVRGVDPLGLQDLSGLTYMFSLPGYQQAISEAISKAENAANCANICSSIAKPPGVDLNKNIKQASTLSNLPFAAKYLAFYNLVRNKGPWDYKQQGSSYQNLGNFNYGATGAAAGIPDQVLLRIAGYAQQKAGTSMPAWGGPLGSSPYGDDPDDQKLIQQGIDYYNKCCTK
jgi:hypothetical protein